jgi:PTH2 family peptidyl-tRNA hydrolase
MGPLEEIRKMSLMELVDALRPYTNDPAPKRLVDIWDHAFEVWGWREPMEEYKLVIVMRKDLKMRAGKMVAQGGHAIEGILEAGIPAKVKEAWHNSGKKKICVRTDSEKQFFDVIETVKLAGIKHHVVTDSGLTEFGGVPTKTCVAIGPDKSTKIDIITGSLDLL